jgi:aspartyl-tRNA(Asn)/glutamyl-tRNA(Gln) amidotransferase subunit A
MNFLGLPALTLPAGFDDNGCPTSLQLIGKPFAEARLYGAGAAFEAAVDFAAKAPSLPS